MRIQIDQFDFGRQWGIGARRGPFRHAVRYKPKQFKERLPAGVKAKAILALREWAKSTTAPRNRLKLIRRRWMR